MKKITALLLCFLLVFFVPTAAYASSAGSVVVSGGSIGSGGLSGGYSQKSESAAITLTMALMYSLGITVKLSQDAINAGQSAYSYVQGKFYEWVGGSSAEQMSESEYEDLKSRFSVINGGSNVDPDGKIYINGTALDMIRRFLNWLTSTNQINNGNGAVVTTGSINGVSTLLASMVHRSASRDDYFGTSTDPKNNPLGVLHYYYLQDGTTPIVVHIFNTSFYIRTVNISNGNYATSAGGVNNHGHYYYFMENGTTSAYMLANNSGINLIPNVSSVQTFYTWLDGSSSGDIGYDTSGGEGFNYNGNFDPNTLNNPDGNQTVVDPPLIDAMKNNNPDANANIGLDKYLEALKQILNQITNPQAVPESVPAQDLPTLAPVEIPVPDNLPVAWPVDLPSSPTATPDLPQDNTPVVDPDRPPDPEVSIPEMSVHLEEYFPFCLPFDVYKIMQKFNGSPQAPEVHLSFDAPTLNIHIPLDLDFSVFDSVASVLRNGESILYVVGLCVVTRKTFLRA